MKRLFALLLGAGLFLLLSTDRGQGADPIGDKLEKSKAKYEMEMKKAKEVAKKYFDDREDKAIKAGDKKLIDQMKDERKAFEEYGILINHPKTPAALKKTVTDQKRLIDAAYSTAISEYTKAKKHDLAAAIEKEQAQLQAKGGIVEVVPRSDLWISLFNGKDLTGWKSLEPNRGQWKVVDGAIQGEDKRKTGDQYYWLMTTQNDFDDFHIRMEIMHSRNCASIMEIRHSDGAGHYNITLSNATAHTGSVSRGHKTLGGVLKLAGGPSPPADQWFTVEIIARGNSITTVVNGMKTVEAIDEDKVAVRGYFAVSVNEEGSIIRLRKIEIMPLPVPPPLKK